MKRDATTLRRHALAAAVAVMLAGAAQAQLSTSTIKGQINIGAAAAKPGLAVSAVNQANGKTYRTSTLADGSYVVGPAKPDSAPTA